MDPRIQNPESRIRSPRPARGKGEQGHARCGHDLFPFARAHRGFALIKYNKIMKLRFLGGRSRVDAAPAREGDRVMADAAMTSSRHPSTTMDGKPGRGHPATQGDPGFPCGAVPALCNRHWRTCASASSPADGAHARQFEPPSSNPSRRTCGGVVQPAARTCTSSQRIRAV